MPIKARGEAEALRRICRIARMTLEMVCVYTGIAFFRQLLEGVPGAWRLFANLLALGARNR